MNEGLYELVLPAEAVSRVLAIADEEPLSVVANDLRKIWESSALGMRLFGWTSKSVAADVLKKCVETELKRMETLEVVDNKAVAELHGRIHEATELAGLGDEATLSTKRQIEISYRGWMLPYEANCMQHEIDARVEVQVRAWSVAVGAVPGLPGEEAIKKHMELGSIKKVSYNVKSAVECRKFVMEKVLAQEEKLSGETTKVLNLCLSEEMGINKKGSLWKEF